jgi:hypothetical protein
MNKEVEQALKALNYISGFASFSNGCYKEKLDTIRKELTKLKRIEKIHNNDFHSAVEKCKLTNRILEE